MGADADILPALQVPSRAMLAEYQGIRHAAMEWTQRRGEDTVVAASRNREHDEAEIRFPIEGTKPSGRSTRSAVHAVPH